MAARGYEFYLRVLKVSLTSERSERVRVTFSTRIQCNHVSNHGDTDILTREDKNGIFTAHDEDMIF